MKLLIPTLVFLGSSMWGYIYGEIPFTSIRPSSSFTQRTISSLKLAGTAYALSDLVPANISSQTLNIARPPEPIYPPKRTEAFNAPKTNDTIFGYETFIPTSLPGTPTPSASDKEKEGSFEGLVIILMIVNCGMLVKLIMYRNEDRITELKSHYDQREYIEGQLYLYAGTLPMVGNYLLRIMDQKMESIEGSIQRLHTKFENFECSVQELEASTNQDRLNEAMERWREFHGQIRELPRETSKALSVFVRTLEASFENSEADDSGTGESED